MKLAIFSCILLSTLAFAIPRDADNEHYVTVPYSGRGSVQKVVEAGFDVGGIDLEKKEISLIVKERDLPRTRSFKAISSRPVGRPDAAFWTFEKLEAKLMELEGLYPHLMTVEKVGSSVEGRPIYGVQLTAKFVSQSGGKPAFLVDAMHHAREVMTAEVSMDIIDYLTKNYSKDAQVQKWMNNYAIWVVPMVNPDGNNKVWNGSAMWRKNVAGKYGVDINRNYTYEWNSCNGSSGSPSSETYRGPSAGSEPETKALMQLASRIRPKFNISYHSYSEIVIYPFGCSPKKIPSPHQTIYEGYGKELAKKLVRDSGSGSYDAGTSYELLYDVDGGSVDFMYANEKIMSFVIEMNSTSQGFQPSYSKWRDITVQRQRAGWMYLLDQMEGPGIR